MLTSYLLVQNAKAKRKVIFKRTEAYAKGYLHSACIALFLPSQMLPSSSFLRYERDRAKAPNSLTAPQALPFDLLTSRSRGDQHTLHAIPSRARPNLSSSSSTKRSRSSVTLSLGTLSIESTSTPGFKQAANFLWPFMRKCQGPVGTALYILDSGQFEIEIRAFIGSL